MLRRTVWVCCCLLIVSLAACGGEEPSPPAADGAGDVASGESLYHQQNLAGQLGCASCHSLEPDVVMVGPSHANVGSVANARVPGLIAEEYLRQSIVEPNAYLVEGFSEGVMPTVYADELSEQEINDLVAYMLTLQ